MPIKKVAFISFILFVILGLLLLRANQIKNKVFVSNSSTALGSNLTLRDHFNNKSAFNILLLGYGGGTHDGAYLTDSMMIMHIDPASKTTILISIPRDMWVKIPTDGGDGSYWKINAAYELGLDDADYPNKQAQFKGPGGGGALAKSVVGMVSGMSIDRFLALDFSGFTKTVDSLGGVDINVAKAFDDYEYPIDGKENDLCGHPQSDLPSMEQQATQSAVETVFPCRFEHLHLDAGAQHMDGEAALKYVRSRHSLQDGTDFGRSTRQRNLLVAVRDKIFSVGFLGKAIPFISSLGADMQTDISPEELKTLLDQASNLNQYKIQNLALSDQNVLKASFSDDGQYILLPNLGLDRWEGVQNWLAQSMDPNRINSAPIIKVENGTHIAGLAALATNRLSDKDLNVLPPSDTQNQEASQSSIEVYSDRVDPKLISELKNEFNANQVNKSYSNERSWDILIIVGQDYNLLQGKKLINE